MQLRSVRVLECLIAHLGRSSLSALFVDRVDSADGSGERNDPLFIGNECIHKLRQHRLVGIFRAV